jgi:hypothetical protein
LIETLNSFFERYLNIKVICDQQMHTLLT